MTRGIWTKWIIGAAFLLLIIAAGCILWYQHTTAQYKQGADKDDKLLKQWEAAQKNIKPPTFSKTPSTQAPADSETPTAEKTVNKVTVEVETPTAAKETQQSEIPDADVPMSEFGLGPYPKVPEGMRSYSGHPYKPVWEDPKWHTHKSIGQELIGRVLIKAWQDGMRDYIGAGTGDDGKVYINYPNTLYITWGEPEVDDDGNIFRQIIGARGDPDAYISPEQMYKGIIPAGIRVLDAEKDAIDAYKYLNLPRQ